MKREIEEIINELESPAVLTDIEIKKVLTINPSGQKLMGTGNKQILNFFNFSDDSIAEISERVKLYGFHSQKHNGYQVEYNKVNSKGNKESVLIRIKNQNHAHRAINEKVRAVLAEEINKVLKHEINQHKLTQEKLYQAQQFSRSIIESSLDMIIAVDKNDKITEFNKAALSFFGYKHEEIIGKPFRSLFAYDIEHEIVTNAIVKHGNYSGEIQYKGKNNKTFSCLLSASRLINNQGEITGSMGISRDISDIKQQQQKIQEQSAKINAIFESSTHMIWSVDKSFNITSYNSNFERFIMERYNLKSGLNKKSKSTEKALDEFFSKVLKALYKRTFREEKQNFELQIEGQKKDAPHWIEVFLSPIYNENEKVVEVAGIANYITYKKQAERKIKEQTAKLKAIFDSTAVLICSFDQTFEIVSSNKNFDKRIKQLFGQKVEKGINYLQVLSNAATDDNKERINRKITQALNGKASQFEVSFERKGGEIFWMEFFLNPILKDENQAAEVSCMAYEITDKKETEQQIRESLKEKEVLLQEVHHRVKNNLQVISSILNLQSSYVKDKITLDILRESQNRIKSMSFIHESLYQTKDFNRVDFEDYITGLTNNLLYSYSMMSQQVNLNAEVDRVFLNLDQAIPCGLIVNELVSNALKYAFPGEKQGRILVKASENKNMITLIVEDNGIGLPENFNIEKTDTLGLQLVYTLIEQLDGEIKVSTKNGTKYLIKFEKLNT